DNPNAWNETSRTLRRPMGWTQALWPLRRRPWMGARPPGRRRRLVSRRPHARPRRLEAARACTDRRAAVSRLRADQADRGKNERLVQPKPRRRLSYADLPPKKKRTRKTGGGGGGRTEPPER